MQYKDVADLQRDTRLFAEESSTDVDLVVGIPRSGLLVANLLCLYLDVPMTDVDGLCDGRIFDTGDRFDESVSVESLDSVLVVDDSVLSGGQMTETRERLAEQEFPFELSYGAIYVSPWGHRYVDRWAEAVPVPRVFEWNLLHHPVLEDACVDIDGVLCRDPDPEENDDGENYREFLRTVEARIVPNQPIGWLVTCRLERYRRETEAWLAEHGIEYDDLVMMDYPDKETRQREGGHAEYKADVYESTGAKLFIESEPGQATEICKRASRPVFCYDTQEMLRPGLVARTYGKSVDGLSRLRERPVAYPTTLGKRLLYRFYHRLSR